MLFCHRHAIFLCMLLTLLNKCASVIILIEIIFFSLKKTFLRKKHNYIASCNAQPPKKKFKQTSTQNYFCFHCIMYTLKIDRVLFVRMYKTTGCYLSACSNRRGTICPHVQNNGVLFVRQCKKMTGYYFAVVPFVCDSNIRSPRLSNI